MRTFLRLLMVLTSFDFRLCLFLTQLVLHCSLFFALFPIIFQFHFINPSSGLAWMCFSLQSFWEPALLRPYGMTYPAQSRHMLHLGTSGFYIKSFHLIFISSFKNHVLNCLFIFCMKPRFHFHKEHLKV